MIRYRTSIFSTLALGALALPAFFSPAVTAEKTSGAVQPDQEIRSLAYRLPTKKAELEPRTTSRVNLSALAREVENSGRIAFPIDRESRVLVLEKNEVRTNDYATFTDRGGKLVRAEAGPCRTYRGWIEGEEGSEVRVYLDDAYFGGTIVTPDATYAIDTVVSETASDSGHLGTVVVHKANREACASCELSKTALLGGGLAKGAGRAPVDTASIPGQPIVNRIIAQRVLKVVTDCDFEYVQARGGVSAANARILSFINTLDPLYQQGVGLRIRVSGQVARDTLPQIYTGTSTGTLRSQLSADWLNRPTPERAFVWMLSGKTFPPATDASTSSSAACVDNQGFAAREGDPGLFGPFATLNLFGVLIPLQISGGLPVGAGDPECSDRITDYFLGQDPVRGDVLGTDFCWKTVAGINAGFGLVRGSCILANAESTVTVVNSSSRIVPRSGGIVTFNVTGPTSNDWQVYSRQSWMTPQVNYATGVVTITVSPISKGTGGSRFGEVVLNGQRLTILQQ